VKMGVMLHRAQFRPPSSPRHQLHQNKRNLLPTNNQHDSSALAQEHRVSSAAAWQHLLIPLSRLPSVFTVWRKCGRAQPRAYLTG
jgi:hypothetical protein